MRKARNSKLALLLVLTMLATLFVGIPAASASTTVWCPKAEVVADGTSPALGSIFINVDPGVLKNAAEQLEIKLPSEVDLSTTSYGVYAANNPAVDVCIVAPTRVGQDNNAIADTVYLDGTTVQENKIIVKLDATNASFASDNAFLRIYINKATIESGFSGDITATLSSPTNFPTGSVVIGTVSSGAATISIDSVKTVTESLQQLKQITIEENRAGALKTGQESIELKLPSGYEWNSVTVGKAWGFNGYTVANAAYDEDPSKTIIGWTLSSNNRTLKISLTQKSSSKGRITVDAKLKIDESVAKPGDVVVEVTGNTTCTPDTLTIAKYQEYGVTVEQGTVAEALAGREDAKIGEFFIKENAAGSLLNGRSINLTLPEFAKWPSDLSDVKIETTKGTNIIGPKSIVDADRHILKVLINGSSSDAATIKIKSDTKIELAANASGDVIVEVSGTAGAKGQVKVATVKAPITGEMSAVNDVKIGVAEQAIGDLTITEAQAKALMEKDDSVGNDGKLKIEAPAGVTFAALPMVEVIEGNVDIGTVTRAAASDNESNRVVVIPIKAQSTKVSKIKVSGIKLTVDRTVPEGPISFKFKGEAVEVTSDNEEWSNLTSVGSVVAANVVTPAPGETKATTVLVAGSTTMKVNGADVTMDVAPYLKNSRLFVSVRFAAQALGVDSNNILWDQATKTATLMTASGRVIQMTVGSKVMTVNGAKINMDVAPEMVSNRVMLPVGWLAQALGATATWDNATSTATLEL